jgi:hypothetical protein
MAFEQSNKTISRINLAIGRWKTRKVGYSNHSGALPSPGAATQGLTREKTAPIPKGSSLVPSLNAGSVLRAANQCPSLT